MARPSLACVLCFVLVLPFAVAAQQSTQPSQTQSTAPTRDPQAISVVTQSLTAAGGAQAVTAIGDYKATGTVTYFWAGQEVTGSTTIQGRGTNQFRIDSTLSSGTYTLVVSNGAGVVKDIRGVTSHISSKNALTKGNLSFPLAELATRLQDTTVSITSLGLVTYNGHQANQIRTERILAIDNTPGQALSKFTTRDFFIDPETFQVLGTQDTVYPDNPAAQGSPHQILFSNYQTVNGILVPFTISELVGGQQTWTIQLTQISFNSGLSDADFQF